MFHRRLFVCLLAGLLKTIFTQLSCKVAHVPQNKPLDLGVNSNRVTLGLRFRWARMTLRMGGYVFNTNTFDTSPAVAEVCALLNAILVTDVSCITVA